MMSGTCSRYLGHGIPYIPHTNTDHASCIYNWFLFQDDLCRFPFYRTFGQIYLRKIILFINIITDLTVWIFLQIDEHEIHTLAINIKHFPFKQLPEPGKEFYPFHDLDRCNKRRCRPKDRKDDFFSFFPWKYTLETGCFPGQTERS